MQDAPEKITHDRPVPFFLRVIAILVIVTGLFGVLFYLLVTIYQFADRNFLYDLQYKGFSGFAYNAIVFTQLLLNVGLLISGMKLLKLKRTGLYVFAVTYLVFAFLSYFLQDEYGWTIPAIGLVILVLIMLHYPRLS